jgi:hypothetical protein
VAPTDRYVIPPLEGFVSNKDAAQPLGSRGGVAADPLEALLYAVFVANSERLTVRVTGHAIECYLWHSSWCSSWYVFELVRGTD